MARKYLVLVLFLLVTVAVSTFYYYSLSPLEHFRPASVIERPRTVPTILAFRGDDDPPTDCRPVPRPVLDNETPTWRRVDDRSEWYVYTAYVDRRPSIPVVRVLAMSMGFSTAPLFCRWWRDAGNSSSVRVRSQELWIRKWDSAKDQYYQPYLLSCPAAGIKPSAVSVVSEQCGQPTHWIRLLNSSGDNSSIKDFVVCLKPLNFEEDVSLRLIEWLELQHLLGADRVYAYVQHPLHPRTREVLRHYSKIGRMVWQKYDAPPGNLTVSKLWQKRRNEMVVYNDCFYRHVHSHRFVVNLDLDEAIVPVTRDSWSELLPADGPASASLAVRNVYFFDTFGEVSDEPSVPLHMHMLRHVTRSANFTPPGFAQKSFFATALAEAVSNHFALRSVRRDVPLLASLDVGRAHLHHYRKDCPPLMERECEENYMKFRERDTLVWKFKDRLVANVQRRMQELGFNQNNRRETDRQQMKILKSHLLTGLSKG